VDIQGRIDFVGARLPPMTIRFALSALRIAGLVGEEDRLFRTEFLGSL
jgi:hypothetical protein